MKDKVTLKVNKNGSLKVIGEVEIVLPDGTSETKGGRFSICRCGLSENKPFCDGAHKGADFDSNWDIEKPAE
jgi:CDGSH-type Zn-finger protein